ncbi:WD repeat-containing protein 26 [Agyrium rufum]|nr:WD repeat-containing protein 26 [Agyrium rufum]
MPLPSPPPTVHTTPKRKRSATETEISQIRATPTRPRIDTTNFPSHIASETLPSEDAPSSPRTAVAGRLSKLNLQKDHPSLTLPSRVAVPTADLETEDSSDIISPQDLGNDPSKHHPAVQDTFRPKISPCLHPSVRIHESTPSPTSHSRLFDLGSTLPPQTLSMPTSPPASPPRKRRFSPLPKSKHSASNPTTSKRTRSPPPPFLSQSADALSSMDVKQNLHASPQSGLSPQRTSSLDRNGANSGSISNSDSDDGTGINGIGFRPTPAVAYSRSQKRRQQIREWKVREEREMRERRAERRRRGVSGDGGGAGGGGNGNGGRRSGGGGGGQTSRGIFESRIGMREAGVGPMIITGSGGQREGEMDREREIEREGSRRVRFVGVQS